MEPIHTILGGSYRLPGFGFRVYGLGLIGFKAYLEVHGTYYPSYD